MEHSTVKLRGTPRGHQTGQKAPQRPEKGADERQHQPAREAAVSRALIRYGSV